MKARTIAALVALPLIAAACAPEIESTIRVSDVLDAVAAGEDRNVPAILRVPQGSEDGCNEGLENLIANLATLAPTTGKGQCIEKDGDNLAEIETEMVVTDGTNAVADGNLFVLTATPGDAVGSYLLSFALTEPMDDIVKVLATNSNELQAEFDPSKFIFTLTNDSDAPIGFTGETVFVDGRPVLPDFEPMSVAVNSSIEITFSDVASVFAEGAVAYTFAQIVASP